MILLSLDFSENNLLKEQLNVNSFYNLPVLDLPLWEHQLRCFSDLRFQKLVFNEYHESIKNDLFQIESMSFEEIKKLLLKSDEKETVIIFRNDVYFEGDFSDYISTFEGSGLIAFKNHKNFCFAIIGDVNSVSSILRKNDNIFNIVKNDNNYLVCNVFFDGYVKPLLNIKDYRELLFDILNEKIYYKPPYVAKGVYVNSEVPRGDFSITPPVYLGSCVQIESGTNIGPNTVVYDETLISKNSVVKDSVLFNNVYISSGCFVDGAIFCENASMKRGSAVFYDSVIGENSVVAENISVKKGSLISKNTRFDKTVKANFHKKEIISLKNKFQGLTPDKATMLGFAVGNVFDKPKILVACDGEPNATVIKLAFISGLMGSGAECFDIGSTYKSMIFYSSVFCECDYSVFISGRGGGTNIEIYNSCQEEMSETECFNLIDFCSKGNFEYAHSGEIKNIRQIHGIKRMYIRELTANIKGDITIISKVNCSDRFLSKIVKEIFNSLVSKQVSKSDIEITFNDSGTSLYIKHNKRRFNETDLKRLVAFYEKKDTGHETNSYSVLWKKDAVFLMMKVLEIYSKSNKSFDSLFDDIPHFYIYTKLSMTPIKVGEISKKLGSLKSSEYDKNGFNITFKDGFVKVKFGNDNNNLKVLAASQNHSYSQELCDFIINLLSS